LEEASRRLEGSGRPGESGSGEETLSKKRCDHEKQTIHETHEMNTNHAPNFVTLRVFRGSFLGFLALAERNGRLWLQ
jgi:hypothetical protein